MNQITPMIDNSGTEYDIPNNELKDFQADMGTGAQRQYLYRTEDGTDYAIPESESKDFLADFPNAQPVRRFQFSDGSTEDVPANEVKAFFDRYETDDKYKADRDERDAKKAELKAKFDKINADADSPVWAGVKEGFKSFGRYLWNPAEEYRIQFGEDNIGTQMFTGAGDAANALVAGVIKIPSGIEKMFGFALGGRSTKVGNYFINDAQGFEAAVDRNLPQNKKAEFMDGDAMEWANKVQNMSSTLFNFTLAGGVGAAGAPTIVAIDSTDAYIDNYDRAIARGAKPEEANAIATEGFMWNAILEGTLINGGIKPMYKGAEKLAATPTIDLTKQTFSGITRGLTVGTLRNYAAKTTGHILSTGAIMGTDAMGKELLRQDADGEERNWTKVWEAGKGGGTEGALMGLMFGTASGMTAASEFRAYHKAMKKTFGDLAMRNINTAQGREMMSKVNPKGTYDFLKAREDGGTPSRKQADRMILPDDLSSAERAKIADDFLRDGITPERIKAEMEAKKPGPKATDIEAEVVEPQKPALTGPETGVEPPTKTPKGVESPESGAVRPVGASEVARVGETTPGAEKPVEAVSGASVEGALAAGAEKAAVKPAETATEVPEEAHSPVLSGDEVRKTMPGYDPKNWRTHVDKSGYVAPRMEKQFQELLSTRKGKGNGEVVFLAGGNGSGKSTVADGLGSTPDFIVDSTLGNLKTAKKQIDAVLANGQKPKIVFVYRTPEEALEGVAGRVENGGHVVSPLSFADSHTKGIKNLRLLADEYGDKISVHVIDNSAEGAPEITLEQLEAKGIPDHAEIRKRANEVLGQYGGLVGDGGAKGPAGGGGEVEGAEAQKGDGKAGIDRVQGRADGREAQREGGGADKVSVAVDRTGVPDWLDDNGVAEIFNAQNFNDGWGSAVSAFFRHRVRTDERLAELRKQYVAETDEAKRKKLNSQYKKRINELWEHQGEVQPQDEMRDAVNAIMDREGSVASQNLSKKDKALKAWNRRYEDVKKLTGAVFDETALSNGDLMKFRKLHENYAKGEDGSADALKKFVEEHQPNESAGPLKTDKPAEAEKPVEAEKSVATEAPKAGTPAPKKDLKTAVRDLGKLRERRDGMNGTAFTGENADELRKDHEALAAELDKEIEAAEAEIESLREPTKPIPLPDKPIKPNPKKAAKIVGDFVATDPTRKALTNPYHDKKSGVVVATNGRFIIATKHGFDPNAKETSEPYPNWQIVIPKEKDLTASIKVNPTELAKVCQNAIRLSRAIGIKPSDAHSTPHVILRNSNGGYSILDANYLLTVAKAMEANGITELRTQDTKGEHGVTRPLMAKNADTTIVIMPLRGGGLSSVGRKDSANVAFDGLTGRIIRAPERTDMGVGNRMMSEEWLTSLRDGVARDRKRAEAEARNTNLFKIITDAWKNGEKDPRAIYKVFNGEQDFYSLSPETQKTFMDLINAGSEAELARKMSEYIARRMPDVSTNHWIDKDPKEIAKIEKRIAAEDEVESLLMNEDEARAMYGMEPRKKAARDAYMQDVEEGERLKKESEEADANIENVNTEIGDLISKHLLAQGTAKNNADGRAMKAKAKSALVDRLSSLTDEEFDSVKQSFKQTMRDNGEDMDRVGEIQAIFNAETSKRNAKSGKPAATEAPKTTAEKVPATSGTRRRITQAYNKWMAAEKPTKETKAKIRVSIEKATSGLTEAQASQLADAYEAYWKAHVNEANAIRAEKAGTVHAVQWRKDAAAEREKAGAKVQKLMEDFEIEIDRDGTWVRNPVNGAKAETSVKPAEPAKAEGTAKKSVTVENATPEDVAQIMADRYNQLHAKDANPQNAEPSRYMKTAELLLKNIRAKNADALISTVANGLNPGSLRAFEVLTGIKMPRSQRDQHIAIDKYCGITPEARAKMEAERKADAEAKAEAEHRANALAEGERIAKETRVKLKTGEVTTAQKLLEAGWTIKKAKRGAVTNLHLVAPDDSGYFRIDGKAFEYMEDFIAKRDKDGAATTPAKGDFLPGGVIEAHYGLESDEGPQPEGWRKLAVGKNGPVVKVPDNETFGKFVEKNYGKVVGKPDVNAGGVEVEGGNIYNVNQVLGHMAGATGKVKPMHEAVRDANDSTSITPQAKLDTFRDYAKSVVSRDGATIADVRDAMYNVDVWPQGSIGETGVNAPDIFFNRLQKMMSDAFRADSRAQGIDAKYRKAENEGERQVLADQFRQYQRQFADNFLKTRRDEILKAFDEIELKPGETVEDAAKREAGVEQKSIGDEAKEIADDVDAAIDAEEADGGNPAAPANAPRGRGTGALPQDQPKSHGPGTKGSKIVTPQTFLRRAQELFPDVAFRRKSTVRMPKWAAAHFEPAIRLIRAKDMNAIGDVSHELGHDIEHLTRYDVPKLPAVKRDLSDLGHQLYGPGTPKPPSYIGEGFAEYVRGYIVNAPNLHQVAPDLDDWFNGAFKQKHPDIVKKLDELRDMVQTMKEQSAAQTVGGFMRPSTETITRAWKKTLDFFSGENWNDSASIILRGMKKSGIARLYHWQDDFRKLEASKDYAERRMLADVISDKIENHPYIFATITRGTASQRVMDMARHGTTSLLGNKKTGESLKDIFADFSPAERDAWKKYAIAKHGIVNYFDKGLDFGLPRDVLEEVVQQYETPKFQDALRRYTDYSHRILHLGVDAGLISQDTYDKIVANHPIYVRITRRYAQDGAGTRQSGQAINRRTGGFDHILDPIDAALMDQEKYLRACFQAKTLQLIIKAGNRASAENVMSITANGGPNRNNMNPQNEAHNPVGAYWPVRVPNAQEAVKFSSGKLGKQLSQAAQDFAAATGADPIPLGDFVKDFTEDNTSLLTIFREKPSYGKHNLVSVYVEGELQTYELPDMKWANMLTDVYDKSEFSALEKTFGLATAGIRLGATTVNPGFAIRNGIRDSLHSAVMSESGAVPGISTLNGMLQQLLGSESAELFRAMGGHMSDLVGVTKEQKWNHGGKVALAQNPLQTVGAYSPIDWVLMKPIVKSCADVLSFPELGPRVREMSGVMAKCRKAGLSEDACAILAMSHAKDISIDFQRAGRLMKHINHYIPFSNAMWRGTEQTARNLGLLPSLPHQFEDRNPKRAARNIGRGLAYITSWVTALAMLEMSGDDKDRRKAFEQSATEKWEYAHIGDWRFPLPFELGFVFGAIPKAAIYEMYGDEGAMKECLAAFNQAMPSKYVNPDTAVGSISLFTPWIGLLRNQDYRGRPIVPQHIMDNREKQDWYTQYTTELSKKIGGFVGASPAQLEYLLDSYTGGLYRRTALMAENIGDTSRLQEGRGFSMLDTLRARPQANRLIEDFYNFGVEGKRKLGSGTISLEEYGKLASQNGVKKQLTAKFDEMRAIRADKSMPLSEQDRRVNEVAEQANEIVRTFNARDDYRQRGIAYAASALTGKELSELDADDKEKYLGLLKGVSKDDIVNALISFGGELVPVKERGVETFHQRWSAQNINQRVGRLLMLMQD